MRSARLVAFACVFLPIAGVLAIEGLGKYVSGPGTLAVRPDDVSRLGLELSSTRMRRAASFE